MPTANTPQAASDRPPHPFEHIIEQATKMLALYPAARLTFRMDDSGHYSIMHNVGVSGSTGESLFSVLGTVSRLDGKMRTEVLDEIFRRKRYTPIRSVLPQSGVKLITFYPKGTAPGTGGPR